jgi:two-component system phosphate regulon sensor histidine kinase PhoR
MIITYINTMAAKLLAIPIESVLEKHASSLPEEKCINLLEKCQKEGHVLRETLELKHRGEKLYLEIVAAPKKDQTGAILVIQDNSEHYRIIEMRKDFIANASHELKTPITIIRGFAEALHDNPGLPNDTYAEITGKIVNNCEKMNTLIKDLLTLTDIEHIPESRLMECNLLELAENTKTTVEDAYPDAKIEVKASEEEDYYLLADPNLIELCLINLVENAAKYSEPPAEITITLKKEKEWMTVSIGDKGLGIPSNELEEIFQRFYRSEKSKYRKNKKIGGSGLGLSIVETIIAKHFGKITVDSVEGEGSTFKIYLPLRSEAGL